MKPSAKRPGVPRAEMSRRIGERFCPIPQELRGFDSQQTNRADVRIAFASYLGEGEEDLAIAQLEVARGIDAKRPGHLEQSGESITVTMAR